MAAKNPLWWPLMGSAFHHLSRNKTNGRKHLGPSTWKQCFRTPKSYSLKLGSMMIKLLNRRPSENSHVSRFTRHLSLGKRCKAFGTFSVLEWMAVFLQATVIVRKVDHFEKKLFLCGWCEEKKHWNLCWAAFADWFVENKFFLSLLLPT